MTCCARRRNLQPSVEPLQAEYFRSWRAKHLAARMTEARCETAFPCCRLGTAHVLSARKMSRECSTNPEGSLGCAPRCERPRRAFRPRAHPPRNSSRLVRGVERIRVGHVSAYRERPDTRLIESRLPGRHTTIHDAGDRLSTFCRGSEHVFWEDSVSVRDEKRFRIKHIQGYRQLTDVYLLGLAVEHDGWLATFDRGIPVASVTGAKSSHLRVIL